MTIRELGIKLREMYENAPKGYQVANIHLFGIKYASEILKNVYSNANIIRSAGIHDSYITELSKGIKLSQYVVPKQ